MTVLQMNSATKIRGDWYDGQQSAKRAAFLCVRVSDHKPENHDAVDIAVLPAGDAEVFEQQALFEGNWSDIKVSKRLGNTSRYVYFPDGQKFESRENEQIDELMHKLHPKNSHSLIYRLETHWQYVLISVLLTVLVFGWGGIYGIPLASKSIAYALPASLMDEAGEQTLELLDEQLFEPTTLAPEVRERVRSHFANIIAEHPEQNIRLYFRHSPEIGANAFALPNGGVVFTDDMIKLAENDDELLSVMAHEVGHVVKRHGMRGVIQGSIVTFSLVLLTGDLSATADLFLGIPIILTQLGYSRSFEREADDYALTYMLARDIDPENFSRLMARLQSSKVNPDDEGSTVDNETSTHDHTNGQWQRYLSTHPGIEERIEKFKRENN